MSNSYEEVQKIPHAGSVMTPFPYFVDSDEEVAEVERLMREHHIRHIPVQQDGRVVGVVSERDPFHLGDRRTTLASGSCASGSLDFTFFNGISFGFDPEPSSAAAKT